MTKTKLFRLNADVSSQLIATADLLRIEKEELLETMINQYVHTVQSAVKT